MRPGHFPRCADSNDVFGFAVGCIVLEFYEEEQMNLLLYIQTIMSIFEQRFDIHSIKFCKIKIFDMPAIIDGQVSLCIVFSVAVH